MKFIGFSMSSGKYTSGGMPKGSMASLAV